MSLPDNPRTGRPPNPHKQTIIEDAKQRIIDGHETLDAIAADHGITSRTLRTWLSALGDEYQQIRSAWIDAMLADAIEEQDKAIEAIRSAEEMFPLARARELMKASDSRFKTAAWYAERRDRQRYGVQQSQNSVSDLNVVINIGSHDASTVVIDGTTNNPQE